MRKLPNTPSVRTQCWNSLESVIPNQKNGDPAEGEGRAGKKGEGKEEGKGKKD